MTCALLCGVLLAAPEFTDHGVAVPVAERRTLAVCADPAGRPLVVVGPLDLSPLGYLLVTDLDTGETTQHAYPAGAGNGALFVSLRSRNGRWYGVAGNRLLEFDLGRRAFTFHGVPAPTESYCTGVAMADGADGRIYAGLGPGCRLVSFDPATQQLADHGQVDPAEHYFSALACAADGWTYAGIGTARCNLVAFHPGTGERHQLLDEALRTTGSGEVWQGTDGQIYGRAAGLTFRLAGGQATAVSREQAAPAQPTGVTGYGGMSLNRTADGRQVTTYDLEARRCVVKHPDGREQVIPLVYQSEGAEITSLVAGPDGRVYASSAHPMHFAVADPVTGRVEDWGPVRRVGGGNFCSMAVQGQTIVAGAYAGGWFYAYDTTRPWNGETGEQPNPRILARYAPDLSRPRATLAHPDGRHVLVGGYMDYGRRGGGLGLVDLTTGESTLLTHDRVIPDQSTIALEALPSGDVVGGTAIDTPGGGHPTAKEAVCYLLDWASRTVVHQVAPWPGAGAVIALRRTNAGLVYGVTSGAGLFVYDPARREVVHRERLTGVGDMVRHGLQRLPDGAILGLFSSAIVRFDPVTHAQQVLAKPPTPIRYGGALVGQTVWYASGSHLWSCRLAP